MVWCAPGDLLSAGAGDWFGGQDSQRAYHGRVRVTFEGEEGTAGIGRGRSRTLVEM